jgi:enoyl reductase-like protein
MLYWTEIWPVITYSSEIWVLQESIKRKLLKTERRIFGPTKNRKIKTTDELIILIRNNNIINYIKAKRLSWFGHVHRMTYDRMFKKLYECQPISTR